MSGAGEAGTDGGMTLLETLVVLGILGLVGSVSVVQLQHALSLFSLREAASQIECDLKQARSEAIRGSRMVGFSVDSDGQHYTWIGHELRSVPSGTALSPNVLVTFYPSGQAAGGPLVVSNVRGSVQLAIAGLTDTVTAGADDAR
jgi:prepilin-type N-terminal cleavage/methylation domain-containing protein